MSGYKEELDGLVALGPMTRTLLDFARAIRVSIEREQRKPNPDNGLIDLLCDSARLGWEQLDSISNWVINNPELFLGKEHPMNLYHIQYDGESYYVEAPSLMAAVAIWKAYVKKLWGDDYDGTEEPESVALVHDDAVLRIESDNAAKAAQYKKAAEELWDLLDHISTLDDACKSDDAAFRNRCHNYVEARSQWIQSDGQALIWPEVASTRES